MDTVSKPLCGASSIYDIIVIEARTPDQTRERAYDLHGIKGNEGSTRVLSIATLGCKDQDEILITSKLAGRIDSYKPSITSRELILL